MAKLNDEWWDAFRGYFQTEEDVIQFIFERLNTSDFEDSYIDCAGYGEPCETIKYSVSDKRERLYDFMMSLVHDD